MTWILIIVGILLLTGAILLSKQSPFKEVTRNDFLLSLAKTTDGTLEPLHTNENSFKIDFTFEKKNFIYEDIEYPGFHGEVYKSFLKIKTSSKLSLSFHEKKRTKILGSKMLLASEIPNEVPEREIKIKLPKGLSGLHVNTSDRRHANALLNDSRASQIFTEYKYSDRDGLPYSSLRIHNGSITLEFQSVSTHKPRPLSEHNNINQLENYLDKLIILAKKVEQYK